MKEMKEKEIKEKNMPAPVVGRINFEPRYPDGSYQATGRQVRALAEGLEQLTQVLSQVLLILDDKLTEMQKQLDEIKYHTWRVDKP